VEKFHYKNLQIELHPEVYEPAEDTFQLLECIEIKKGDKVFEIGTGCGVVALECARRGADVVCSDVNPFAVKLTGRNYFLNESLISGGFDVRKGDLFSVVKPGETFDVIVFNPPYLPTKKGDNVGGWFDVATGGGMSGLVVIERFLGGLKDYVKTGGRVFFVFSSLASRDKLESILSENVLDAEVVLSRNYDDEIIDIYCISF
jgi:release factor glutamine methyltransferase